MVAIGINLHSLAGQTIDIEMMEKQDNPIIISEKDLKKYGFVCFYHEPKPVINRNYWEREVEMAVVGIGKTHIQKFIIPESLLVKLHDNSRISQHQSFQISPDNNAVEVIKLLSERAGWNQTLEDLKLMNTHAQKEIFIAMYCFNGHDISLGSGVAFAVNDHQSWIGMILVHAELRRQGIARGMMNTCLSQIRKHQKQTIIGLDATPHGKQVYEALGFKDSFSIWRSVISTRQQESEVSKSQFIPFDDQKVQNYLSEIGYIERQIIVQLLASIPGSFNLMITHNGEISGFALSRPGRLKPFVGPLIAASKEMAHALLMNVLVQWQDRGFGEVFMDIPEYHIGKQNLFFDPDNAGKADKFQIEINPARSFSRMYQMISTNETGDMQFSDPVVMQRSVEAYEQSKAWVEKEKKDIIPKMYGISGPEWS
jgi:predicted GNAT family N-acyltransferase